MSTFHGLLLLLFQAFRLRNVLHRNRGILPPLFHYPPPLIFESHRIYRRRNFIINHFSLVQASNTEFSQPGNRDENRFNFWKNANTRISPFIFILFLAFLLERIEYRNLLPFSSLLHAFEDSFRFGKAKDQSDGINGVRWSSFSLDYRDTKCPGSGSIE